MVDTSPSRKQSGTGLGLTIASGIVSLMGGTLAVKSEVGKGSTFQFTVTFPQARTEPDGILVSAVVPSEATPSGRDDPHVWRILVVDDVPPNREYVRHKLEKEGYQVVVAESGIEALERSANEPFDLIFMDVQMPGLDGFEAVRRIRQREADSPHHVPIIAMTAHARSGDRERCLLAGMDGYVSKPIAWNECVAAIREVSERHAAKTLRYVDEARLLERTDGDRRFLTRMLASFLEVCPGYVAAVSDAMQARDCRMLATISHTLKGAVATLFGSVPFPSLLNLEAMATSGSIADAERVCQELTDQMELAMDELRTLLQGLPK